MKHIVRFTSMALMLLFAGALTLVSTSKRMGPGSDDTNHAQDEAAIRKMVADSTDAWNRRDAKALTSDLTEDSDHIGAYGGWTSGRSEIQKVLAIAHENTGENLTSAVERIRFITADVAVVIVSRGYKENGRESGKAISTLVFHKMNGKWLIEGCQNTLIQPREEAIAQAARASSPMAQTEPEVIMPANSKTDFSADVAVIRKRVADGVDAWNRRDAKALAAHISEDHDQIGVAGGWGSGRAQFEKALTAALAATHNNQRGAIAKIRFITPDVAIVIVRFEYTNDKETLKSISSRVLHKMNGEWWNEAFQNTYVRPTESSPSPHPREQRQ